MKDPKFETGDIVEGVSGVGIVTGVAGKVRVCFLDESCAWFRELDPSAISPATDEEKRKLLPRLARIISQGERDTCGDEFWEAVQRALESLIGSTSRPGAWSNEREGDKE